MRRLGESQPSRTASSPSVKEGLTSLLLLLSSATVPFFFCFRVSAQRDDAVIKSSRPTRSLPLPPLISFDRRQTFSNRCESTLPWASRNCQDQGRTIQFTRSNFFFLQTCWGMRVSVVLLLRFFFDMNSVSRRFKTSLRLHCNAPFVPLTVCRFSKGICGFCPPRRRPPSRSNSCLQWKHSAGKAADPIRK